MNIQKNLSESTISTLAPNELLQQFNDQMHAEGQFSENGSCLKFVSRSKLAPSWNVEMRVTQEEGNDVFVVDCHLPRACYSKQVELSLIDLIDLMNIPSKRAPRTLLPRVAKYAIDFETRQYAEGFDYIVLTTKVVLPRGQLDYGMVRWVSGDSLSKFELAALYLEANARALEAEAQGLIEDMVTHEAPNTVQ